MKNLKLFIFVLPILLAVTACTDSDEIYEVIGDDGGGSNIPGDTTVLKKFELDHGTLLNAYYQYDSNGYQTSAYAYVNFVSLISEATLDFSRSAEQISQIQSDLSVTVSGLGTSTSTQTSNFTYNSDGTIQKIELVESGSTTQTLTFTYAGNTVYGVHKVGETTVGDITYVYNSGGQLQSRTIIDTDNNTFTATISYTGNNITNITCSDEFGEYYNSDFTYDGYSNPLYIQSFDDIEETLYNNLFADYDVDFSEYNEPGDVEDLQLLGSENNLLTNSYEESTYEYTYNDNDYPSSAIYTVAGSTDSGTLTYTYF